jgi:autotransporter translocation and assembly factor TamB
VLTKDKVSIDLELENLLKFKAKQDGDVVSGTLDTNKLLLAYKGYGSTKLTTKLQMYQSKEKLAVTGFIELKDTDITYESSYLDVSKDQDIIIIKREDKGKKKEDTFKKNTFLDIDIRAKNEIIYKVPAGEVEMKPDMNIRKELGQGAKITGKLKILDGFYDVAGKRFLLKEGAVAFRGVEKINPLLDLHVEYDEVDDILIKIDIGGDKNRPKLNFTSEPMMSKKDILSALLFGFVVSESDGAASSANKAAENIFGRAVAQDLARELKLDRLDLNRNDLGGIDIKAGKKIKRKTIIYYKNKSNESSVIYEKKLDKKWSIETEVGKKGYGVDLFFRKGYK